jgi:lambda family phage portal protein
MSKAQEVVTVSPIEHKAVGGGLEGAARHSRELFSWNPQVISPDQQLHPVKEMADARSRDSVQNDGYALGALNTYRDSIVGAQYRLNCQPDYETLGFDEGWAEEFQTTVESRFNLLADSAECWFDASRNLDFTSLVRLAVAGHVLTGEVLATAEWRRDAGRPFSTALQMVSPSRLSNPDMLADDRYLRRGKVLNDFGEAIAFWIRSSHPSDYYDLRVNSWRRVETRKPWGRLQVIHIYDPLQPGQSRGVSDMVSVLKQMRMTKKFQDVVLQNAVVNATYAAAIESELPSEVVFGSMGAGGQGFDGMLGKYMTALGQYAGASNNIAIDGVKMPHLFPGTKLALKPMGTPGGVGTDFERSLLRHTSAALGMSYEQFSKDYTNTNYSSARASMAETFKGMQSKKKTVADRYAKSAYTLWFEEELNAGNVPLPRGVKSSIFYDPVMREALLQCDWIGASRGQIDELKETEAAVMRINEGLSTREEEAAKLGKDWRRVFRQRAREDALMKKLGLEFGAKQVAEKQVAKKQANATENRGDNTDQ